MFLQSLDQSAVVESKQIRGAIFGSLCFGLKMFSYDYSDFEYCIAFFVTIINDSIFTKKF